MTTQPSITQFDSSAEAVLHEVVQGTAAVTGQDFLSHW